jgi:hypothetical protein
LGRQTWAASSEQPARAAPATLGKRAASQPTGPSGELSPGYPVVVERSHLGSSRRRPSRVRRNGRGPRLGGSSTLRLQPGRVTEGRHEMREHVERGRALAPCGSAGGGAAGCNPESSFTSATSRCDSARATLMSTGGRSSKRASFGGSPCSMGRVVSSLATSERPHHTPLGSSVAPPSQGASRRDGKPSARPGNAARIVVASVDRARRTRPYV